MQAHGDTNTHTMIYLEKTIFSIFYPKLNFLNLISYEKLKLKSVSFTRLVFIIGKGIHPGLLVLQNIGENDFLKQKIIIDIYI